MWTNCGYFMLKVVLGWMLLMWKAAGVKVAHNIFVTRVKEMKMECATQIKPRKSPPLNFMCRRFFFWSYVQVLQSASEECRCLDTFRGSHNNILYIFCHNPMSRQRQCTEFWDVSLHTDVKFRSECKFVVPPHGTRLVMRDGTIINLSSLELHGVNLDLFVTGSIWSMWQTPSLIGHRRRK